MFGWWRVYLGVGFLASVAQVTVLTGLARDLTYLLIGVSAFAAMLLGIRLHQPRHTLPWFLMTGAGLSWVVGDAVYTAYADSEYLIVFVSAADVFYLLAYPLIAGGVGLLIWHRESGPDLAGAIDSAIVTVGVGLLVWVFVAEPILYDSIDPLTHRIVAVAYPVFDIVLLAFAARLLTGRSARTPAVRLLVASTLLLIVADTVFAGTSTSEQYTRLLDLVWLLSYLFWGAAALHPSMATLSDPGRRGTPQPLTAGRLLALTAAVLISPVTLGVQLSLGTTPDAWAVVVTSIVLFLLVVTRMTYAIAAMQWTARQRDALRQTLTHQAAHDSLTGLANRAYVLELIDAALHRSQRTGNPAGLFFIDLDHFKTINDTLGHRTGDEVLREAARRMRNNVREGDTVGRLGGDEFVVLMEGLTTEKDIIERADRLVAVIAEPIEVDGRTLAVGASIGITVSLDASTDVSQLLHEADVASYRAKAAGRGRSAVFGDVLRRELEHRAEVEAALTSAIADGDLILHYQPVVNLSSGITEGYEALIRWDRPGHGLQYPDAFVPVAEKSDLICELDRWVLRAATCQLARWCAEDPDTYGGLSIAVNVSGRHLLGGGIVADVAAALEESGLPARRLTVEITETVLVDVPTALVHLRELRELGVSVSIDDFGTGYTSIGQMQDLLVDTIKIDKDFVNVSAAGSRELVGLMINAAHACGLHVVAEGVEDQAQLDMLEELACDSAQGFYFARPMPVSEILARRMAVVAATDVR